METTDGPTAISINPSAIKGLHIEIIKKTKPESAHS